MGRAPDPSVGNTQALGMLLYSRFLWPFEITSLVLLVGNTLTINLTLQVGGLEETVTVTGSAPLVDTSSASVGGKAVEFAKLPGEGNVLSMLFAKDGRLLAAMEAYVSAHLWDFPGDLTIQAATGVMSVSTCSRMLRM